MKVQDKTISAIAVSAFFVLTALVFAPGHLFLTNAGEFNATYLELLRRSLLFALPVFIVLAVALTFLTEQHGVHEKVIALVLMVSFLLWLQGNYLVWNYGVLTGSEIEFSTLFLILDSLIWITLVSLALLKSASIYRHARFVSGVFVLVQLVAIFVLAHDQPDLSDLKRYTLDSSNRFTFSQDRNVIVLVLDTVQSDVFEKIVNEDASYRNMFGGFTYYRDALGGFATTKGAVPNILTGQYYDNSIPYTEFIKSAYLSSTSLPKGLLEAGYEVHYFGSSQPIYLDEGVATNLMRRRWIDASTLRSIYDVTLFRYAPDVLKRYIYRDGRWLLSATVSRGQSGVESDDSPGTSPGELETQFDPEARMLSDVAFVRDMMTRSTAVEGISIFKYYHLTGAHPPYLLNERLEYGKMTGLDGYESAVKASLQIANHFLNQLKKLNVYDNSMIFIVGDHGRTSTVLRQEEANPLFLVKRPGDHDAMVISDAPVCLSDIPATVFAELDIHGDYTGMDILDVKESDSRERRYFYYNWFTLGFSQWQVDSLPPIDQYVVRGPVLSSDSWQFVRRLAYKESLDELTVESGRLTVEWGSEFSLPTGDECDRFGCSPATLTVHNDSNQDCTATLAAKFFTGGTETSNLTIAGDLFSDSLKIDIYGVLYTKEMTVPPGEHVITFSCDAANLDLEGSLRPFLFVARDFQVLSGGLAHNPQLESLQFIWGGGFSKLEGTTEGNWRWCSEEGTLTIFNPLNIQRTFRLEASFVTGHPEPSNLSIESTVLDEDLLISTEGYNYERQLVISPGRHVITFRSDAERLHAPNDPRYIVFGMRKFQMVEID